MKSSTIALFTSDEGHYSIALAIKAALSEYQVEVFKEEIAAAELYALVYHYFPQIFSVPFEAMKNKLAMRGMRQFMNYSHKKNIQKFYDKHQPDLLINTYLMFNQPLEDLQQENNTPLLNVITDPLTFHPVLISYPPALNLVFDEHAAKLCNQYLPEAQTAITGWFVRPEFESNYNQTTVRKELNLDYNLTTFLIAGGSEGSAQINTLVKKLVACDQPLQLVVACGKNQTLLNEMKKLDNSSKKNSHINLIPLAFTDEIHRYMQASDLVVGKAGPNMIFEAVATHTPFFAYTHISGQETGNLDLIRQLNLGYVEENPDRAFELLSEIATNPQTLTQFTDSLKKVADHNAQAKKNLQNLVRKALQ